MTPKRKSEIRALLEQPWDRPTLMLCVATEILNALDEAEEDLAEARGYGVGDYAAKVVERLEKAGIGKQGRPHGVIEDAESRLTIVTERLGFAKLRLEEEENLIVELKIERDELRAKLAALPAPSGPIEGSPAEGTRPLAAGEAPPVGDQGPWELWNGYTVPSSANGLFFPFSITYPPGATSEELNEKLAEHIIGWFRCYPDRAVRIMERCKVAGPWDPIAEATCGDQPTQARGIFGGYLTRNTAGGRDDCDAALLAEGWILAGASPTPPKTTPPAPAPQTPRSSR